ncbi:MAG: hypothetical protein CL840_07540 [Crocinitomicaceae bacterium]|nr:hypothetical protein [Crocinitomicaceae bacterium]
MLYALDAYYVEDQYVLVLQIWDKSVSIYTFDNTGLVSKKEKITSNFYAQFAGVHDRKLLYYDKLRNSKKAIFNSIDINDNSKVAASFTLDFPLPPQYYKFIGGYNGSAYLATDFKSKGAALTDQIGMISINAIEKSLSEVNLVLPVREEMGVIGIGYYPTDFTYMLTPSFLNTNAFEFMSTSQCVQFEVADPKVFIWADFNDETGEIIVLVNYAEGKTKICKDRVVKGFMLVKYSAHGTKLIEKFIELGLDQNNKEAHFNMVKVSKLEGQFTVLHKTKNNVSIKLFNDNLEKVGEQLYDKASGKGVVSDEIQEFDSKFNFDFLLENFEENSTPNVELIYSFTNNNIRFFQTESTLNVELIK